jgi:NADPH-dependent 2,4-dienoyl-CoA reductase/sulfur reductase-like enzyme/rhodanese-related sulfurtransferase
VNKIIIVGGVAAGMSAATRIRRLDENVEIIVLEKSGYVSYANCGLPYYIGDVIKDREELLIMTPEDFRMMFNIDVRVNNEVLNIDRDAKKVKIKNLEKSCEYEETYDKLILCPGAKPIKPDLPGIDSPKIYSLRNVEDTDSIKKVLTENAVKDVVVIGGGYIGVEMAENLQPLGMKVTLVGRRPYIIPPLDFEMARPLEERMQKNGINLHLGDAAKAFHEENGKITVELQSSTKITADVAILAIGVTPDTDLAVKAGLDTGQKNGIKVNGNMLTSDPDIYAAGDAVEVTDAVLGVPAQVPLAGPANRQGRIAADNICGRKSEYVSSLGTSVIKVYDLCVAFTGTNEKNIRNVGIEYKKVYLQPANHAGYYPNAVPVHMKVLFAKEDGRILGAQAWGEDGIDKRIDVIATAMKAGMTVYDLENLELSYSPPYGSAKDPVNMVGFTASNILRGDVDVWYPEDFPEKTKNGIIIDVRSEAAYKRRHIPGAINIPLEEIRSSLERIPKDKDIFLQCWVGYTSYLVYRILKQKGYGKTNCLKTLTGGINTFRWFHECKTTETQKV